MASTSNKKTLSNRLALSAAVATALLSGYGSRQAYAVEGSCTGGSGTYTCSGAAYSSINLFGDQFLTITTTTGFGLDTTGDDSYGLMLSSFGDINFTDSNASSITADTLGIKTYSLDSGATTITTTGTVTANTGTAIDAINYASATDLTIYSNVTSGATNGIYTQNLGTGNTIITSTTSTGGSAGILAMHGIPFLEPPTFKALPGYISITSAEAIGGSGNAIGAYNGVAGDITITSTVSATSTGPAAISAFALNGDVTVNAAYVSGGDKGIDVSADTGDINITSTGEVTGSYKGIQADTDSGSITINTEDIVTSEYYGINAESNDGNINITSADLVTATNHGDGIGINARAMGPGNIGANGNIVISASDVDGGYYGIKAISAVGNINITSTGTVTSLYGYAVNASSNSGIVIIDMNDVSAYRGIKAYSGDSVNITVSGVVTTTDPNANYATIDAASINTTITLDSGAAVSAASGIAIRSNQAANITVNSGASITGSVLTGKGAGSLTLNGGTLNVLSASEVVANLINNSGIVNAQNDVRDDTITVAGNFRQEVDGTLRIGATSDTEHGSLNVRDTAFFAADTTIDIDVAEGNTLTASSSLLNVITAGTLEATTFTITDNSALLDFQAVIDGNTVDLTQGSAQTIVEATGLGATPAALGAAAVFDSSPAGLATVVDELNLLATEQQVANAVESTLPGASGGVSQMTNIATNAVTGIVSARQDLTRGLSSGDGFMTDRHIWFKPFGGWTEQDTRQGVSGYDIDSYGLALGFDGDVSSSWNVGVALAYINSDVESNLAAGSHTIDMDSYLAKVYATKMFDDVTALNLQVGAGISDYDSTRRIFTGDVANADYDSWNMQLSAELERSYQVSDKTVITPYVHADYSYVNVEDYSETGADALNLNVANDSADSLIIGAGVKGNHAVSDSLLLMANAGVGYDVMTDRSSLTSSFAGGGANFTTEGIEPDELVYNAGIGAKYSLENGTEITASYNIDARQDYTDQSVSANFRLLF